MELGTVPRYALQTYPVPVNLMNSIHNNYNGYAKKKPKTNSNFRKKNVDEYRTLALRTMAGTCNLYI